MEPQGLLHRGPGPDWHGLPATIQRNQMFIRLLLYIGAILLFLCFLACTVVPEIALPTVGANASAHPEM